MANPIKRVNDICPNCRFKPREEAAFCPACGEFMGTIPQPNIFDKTTNVLKQKKRLGNLIGWPGCICAVLFVAAGLFGDFLGAKLKHVAVTSFLAIAIIALILYILTTGIREFSCPICKKKPLGRLALDSAYGAPWAVLYCDICGTRIFDYSPLVRARMHRFLQTEACSFCGEKPQNDDAFCIKCGSNLGSSVFADDKGEFNAAWGIIDEGNQCPGCGGLLEVTLGKKGRLKVDFNYCPQCGFDLKFNYIDYLKRTRTKNTNNPSG